jgi:hypothetical protein
VRLARVQHEQVRALANVRKSWLEAGGLERLQEPIDRTADVVDLHDHQARAFEQRRIVLDQVVLRTLDVDLKNVDRAVRDVIQEVDVGDFCATLHTRCRHDAGVQETPWTAAKLTLTAAEPDEPVHHATLPRETGVCQSSMDLFDQIGEALDDDVPGLAAPEPLLEQELAEYDEMPAVAAEVDDGDGRLIEVLEEPPIVCREENVPETSNLPSAPQHQLAARHIQQGAGRDARQPTIEKPAGKQGADSSRSTRRDGRLRQRERSPMHLNSRLIFEKYATKYFPAGTRVLEIGPDGFPSAYRKMVDRGNLSWDTIDIYHHPNLTHVAPSEYSFPVPDESYDVVVSGQVIEHVRKIWVWMREVVRVCKVGGTVITINPVSWPYHEAPIDCWRAYPEGMKALYEDSSLEVIFSAWESLEEPTFRKYIPGVSREFRSKPLALANRILGRFGYPVERAYDTITIGRKAPRTASAS